MWEIKKKKKVSPFLQNKIFGRTKKCLKIFVLLLSSLLLKMVLISWYCKPVPIIFKIWTQPNSFKQGFLDAPPSIIFSLCFLLRKKYVRSFFSQLFFFCPSSSSQWCMSSFQFPKKKTFYFSPLSWSPWHEGKEELWLPQVKTYFFLTFTRISSRG